MIIVCDIDNCLNDLMLKTIELYNTRYGKTLKLSDITAYNFSECLSQQEENDICALFQEKELWDSLQPLPDSQWGIETLMNMGHKVVFATATHECNLQWKCDWMAKYFPIKSTREIIRIQDKSLLRADVMIDDCMEHLTKSYCERICIDYEWNRDNRKDYVYDIHRVHNWKEIINVINDVERKNKEWRK